jgi:hypothetical protein
MAAGIRWAGTLVDAVSKAAFISAGTSRCGDPRLDSRKARGRRANAVAVGKNSPAVNDVSVDVMISLAPAPKLAVAREKSRQISCA